MNEKLVSIPENSPYDNLFLPTQGEYNQSPAIEKIKPHENDTLSLNEYLATVESNFDSMIRDYIYPVWLEDQTKFPSKLFKYEGTPEELSTFLKTLKRAGILKLPKRKLTKYVTNSVYMKNDVLAAAALLFNAGTNSSVSELLNTDEETQQEKLTHIRNNTIAMLYSSSEYENIADHLMEQEEIPFNHWIKRRILLPPVTLPVTIIAIKNKPE
jgi:hypothetical protein